MKKNTTRSVYFFFILMSFSSSSSAAISPEIVKGSLYASAICLNLAYLIWLILGSMNQMRVADSEAETGQAKKGLASSYIWFLITSAFLVSMYLYNP